MVAEGLAGSEWIAVDCGLALENAAGIVRREQPDLLVIVDAACMKLAPGEVRRLSRPATEQMLVSTHGLPLGFFLDRLESTARETAIIGVEPKDLSYGEGLSTEVASAVERLVELLISDAKGLAAIETLD